MEIETNTQNQREIDFAAAAEALEKNVRTPLLCEIIERRAVINRLRTKRVAWTDIAVLLCEFNIQIAPGTLKNYASRIASAMRELEAVREESPTATRIYELCCQRARPGGEKMHYSGRSHPKSITDRASTSARQSPAMRPAPGSNLMRNHNKEL